MSNIALSNHAIAWYKHHMDILERILSSKVRASLFTILFGVNEVEAHTRELARQSGFAEASIRQELASLTELDIIESRRDGNRRYFKANKRHPLFVDIRQVVMKTRGIVPLLKEALDIPSIQCAFIFGSTATGTLSAKSDVDLVVIGDINLRQLSSLLMKPSEIVAREINPHLLSPREYQDRMKKQDHFVTHVISGEKLFVKGTQHELNAMV